MVRPKTLALKIYNRYTAATIPYQLDEMCAEVKDKLCWSANKKDLPQDRKLIFPDVNGGANPSLQVVHTRFHSPRRSHIHGHRGTQGRVWRLPSF